MEKFILFAFTLCCLLTTTAIGQGPGVSGTKAPALKDIPDSFTYQCSDNGDITIDASQKNFKNSKLKLVNPTDTCISLYNTNTYNITGCGKNKDLKVILELSQDSMIVGGKNFKEFMIQCHEDAYTMGVSISAFAMAPAASPTSLPTVTISPSPVSLNMIITENGTEAPLSSAVLGQALSLMIKTDDSIAALAPISCEAYIDGGIKAPIWNDKTCGKGSEIVGQMWKEHNNLKTQVELPLYGFHLKGDNNLNIKCSVKICPTGLPSASTDCDLSCTHLKRRRRSSTKLEGPGIKDVHTTIYIKDRESEYTENHAGKCSKSITVLMLCALLSSLKRLLG